MSRNLLLLALVLTGMAAAPRGAAEELLDLRAQAAWHGLLKPGASTEIAVTLLSDRNGAAEIVLPDHEPRLRVGVTLAAHEPHTLWLTVRPTGAGPLRIEARMPGVAPLATEVRFEPAPGPAEWVATTMALPSDPAQRPLLFGLDPAGLPRTPGAYGSIDAVILSGRSPAALDARQWAALLDYAAGCGRIILVAVPPPWSDELSAAGCGARAIARAGDGAAALAAIREPRGDAAHPLPAPSQLETLLEDDGPAGGPAAVLLFFALYVVALASYAYRPRGRAPLWLLPVAAAGLGGLAWSNDRAERQVISWSEIDAGGHALRYAALLRITGQGRGETRALLPPHLGLPRALTAHPAAELRLHETDAAAARLEVKNYLLAAQSFTFRGSMRREAPLSVSVTGRGPVIENRGQTASPPALLGWNDRRDPVPALQPGERWHPPEHGTPWNVAHAAERLLRSRAQRGTAAVLMPHRLLPTSGDGARIEERGWLLIVSS